MTKARKRKPIRPGEILLEEFMKPNDISQNRLARDIDVNPARVNDIVHGRSAITATIALRLARYFGTTADLWMNLQSGYELRRARLAEGATIERRVRVMAAE
jgi:addiction module HigA family antidote